MYAYLSWGIRYRAESKEAAEEKLESLGFRVPDVPERQMYDILIPTVLLIALVTMIFSLVMDYLSGIRWIDPGDISSSVVNALSSAVAAALMYGYCVRIALKERGEQIERKSWRQASPRCYIPIALKAGLSAWLAIVVSSVLLQWWQMLPSFVTVARWLRGLPALEGSPEVTVAMNSLISKIAMPFPWVIAGATLGVILATRMAGDIRRTTLRDRSKDAFLIGGAMGLAAAAAMLIQSSVEQQLLGRGHFEFVLNTGFAGFICGWLVGFLVPQLAKSMILSPPNPENIKALKNLRKQATIVLADENAVDDWLFKPHPDLRCITPAEAIGYKGRATGVKGLLDEITDERATTRVGGGVPPRLVEGGTGVRKVNPSV
jgi:hypothetical protein